MTILVADDDPFNLRLLTELCEAAGYDVIACGDGQAVLDTIARERPALVLLDVKMPRLDGFEVMAILKADANLASIPIIVVTSADDVETRERGIALGAEDYVTKPFRVFELQQRIRNVLRVSVAETAAAAAREEARDKGTVDPLTHAGTAQQLRITLDYEFTRAARYKNPLTCIIVRVANYVDIVEHSGRDSGEGVLVQTAAGLRQAIRGIDHLFRSDVDEFTMLLPETNAKGAQVVLDRITEQAGDRSLFGPAIQPPPALGIGQSALPDDDVESGGELLTLAVDRSKKPS